MPESYLSATGAALPPTLIARAGMDNPGLLSTIDHFVARALSLNEPIEVQTHPDGVHDFDVRDDDARTREIISRTLDFVRVHMQAPPRDPDRLPAGKLYAGLLHGDVAGVKAYCSGRGRQEEALARVTAENTLNLAGYLLLQQANVTAALDVFRWVVELYPDSPNAYDSLGDGYEAAGQRELAIENSRRCLEMLEKDTRLPEDQKAAIYRSASGKLERLSPAPRQ